MQNRKQIVLKIVWSIIGLALLFLFIIAWKEKAIKICQGVEVEMVGENTTALFMNEQEIAQILVLQNCKKGISMQQLNLPFLEHYLEHTGWIKNAELYFDNQFILQVKIEQRIPIARIFSVTGNSFYVDQEAKRLPLKQLSILRLPVFTGFTSNQEKLSKPDSLLLNEMVHFATIINKDSFFNAQIAQINIAPNGDFEMIPSLGDHLVLFGKPDSLENKLNRLYTFYKKIWLPSGINAFQVLDLRFDHQIVALNKGMYPIQFNGANVNIGNGTVLTDTITASVPMGPTVIKHIDSVKIKPKIIQKKSNKTNTKSLNKVRKTAKALMPKRSTPKTTN